MILVTGAAGFVGSHVTRELASRGTAFRFLARDPASGDTHHPAIRGELGDAASLRAAMGGSSGLIHLACTLSSDASVVLQQDVAGFLALLAAWEAGPVVLASSMDVYPSDAGAPLSEASPPRPDSWYGLGKLICEQALRLTGDASGFPGVALRIPYVIGVHPRIGGSAFGRLVQRILEGRDVTVPGSGAGTSWVAADELAVAIARVVAAPVAGVYNIASGWTTWLDAAQCLVEECGSRSRILVAESRARAGRRLDTRLLRETCRIDAGRSLRTELRALAAYLRAA